MERKLKDIEARLEVLEKTSVSYFALWILIWGASVAWAVLILIVEAIWKTN